MEGTAMAERVSAEQGHADLGKVDRIARIWGTRTPYGREERWPVRVDQVLACAEGALGSGAGRVDLLVGTSYWLSRLFLLMQSLR